MIDYGYIFAQAWRTTRQSRALWFFGSFFFLVGGLTNQGNLFSNVNTLFSILPSFSPDVSEDVVAVIVGILLLLGGAWALFSFLARPILQTILIGLPQTLAQQEAVTLKRGWQWGLSIRALNVFLLNFFVRLPVSLLYFGTFCAAFSPLLLVVVQYDPVQLLGAIATGGAFLIWLAVTTVFNFFVTPFIELGWRFTVLHDLSPLRSIRFTYSLLRERLKDFVIATLALFILRLLWRIMVVIILVMVLAVAVLGFVLSGLVINNEAFSVLLGGLIVLLGLPMLILFNGLFATFYATVWNLLFKQFNLTFY